MSDPNKPDDPRHEEDLDVVTRRKVERPPLYRVIFHNDDYTTRDFVVMVLMRFFHKSHSEATTVMLHVHTKGAGVAGVYPLDIARTKVAIVEKLAREHEMPLKLSMEPDD
ncbi:MAG: ATP-dependent Clp protease adaptor ClpS [Bradymonadia bacterium]